MNKILIIIFILLILIMSSNSLALDMYKNYAEYEGKIVRIFPFSGRGVGATGKITAIYERNGQIYFELEIKVGFGTKITFIFNRNDIEIMEIIEEENNRKTNDRKR